MIIVVFFAMHGCEKVRSLLKKTNMLFIYVQAFISRNVQMIQNDLLYNKIEVLQIQQYKRRLKHQKNPLLTKSNLLLELWWQQNQ